MVDAAPYSVNFQWAAEDGSVKTQTVFERNSHVPNSKMITFFRFVFVCCLQVCVCVCVCLQVCLQVCLCLLLFTDVCVCVCVFTGVRA